MSKIVARRLALLLAVSFMASAVLGQEAEKKTPAPTRPRIECDSDNCVSKVLYLPNFSTPVELQDVVNTFRTLADITHLYPNASEHTIALKGTPEQLAIAEKLVTVFESLRTAPGRNSSSVLVYESKGRLSGTAEGKEILARRPQAASTMCELSTCVIKVLYLPSFSSPVEIQDMVNLFRTIVDTVSTVPNPSRHTIALKGTPEQLAIAERLVGVLEGLRSSGDQKRSSVLVYQPNTSAPQPAVLSDAPRVPCDLTSCYIKVVYLPDYSMGQLQDAFEKVRTSGKITRLMLNPSSHVMVFRGNSGEVAAAEQLANE